MYITMQIHGLQCSLVYLTLPKINSVATEGRVLKNIQLVRLSGRISTGDRLLTIRLVFAVLCVYVTVTFIVPENTVFHL
jgi:hypothetical protein